MGPLAACVYGADKALPFHDTYIQVFVCMLLIHCIPKEKVYILIFE